MKFEEYAAQQTASLLRLAHVLTRDASLAEDITQTTLTNAYRRWPRIRRTSSPNAYVRRMLVNSHLDWCRRQSSTEWPTDLSSWEPPETAPDPAEVLASREQIRHALDSLPARARTALVLRYYADLDDAGIADAMNVSVSAVRSTISRALRQLRASNTMNALKEAP